MSNLQISKDAAGDCAYIAGIFRHRYEWFTNYHFQLCMEVVANCLKIGIDYDVLLGEAKIAASWAAYRDNLDQALLRHEYKNAETGDDIDVLTIGVDDYLVPAAVSSEVDRLKREVLAARQPIECLQCGYIPSFRRTPTCAGRKTDGEWCNKGVREWGIFCHIHADQALLKQRGIK